MEELPAPQKSDALTLEDAITNLKGEDLGLRVYAAWWLGRFRVNQPEAISLLIAALDDEDDRTHAGGYPLRRNAARALGKLGDRRAVPGLIRALGCTDFYVREAAAQSLEMVGDATGIPTLLDVLNNRIPGTQPASEPPYLVQPYDAILEALGGLGATEAIPGIQPFLTHDVPRIQFAAARALYQLTADPQEAAQYGERLKLALAHDDLQLRRSALSDIGAIGYFPAAEAIAETLAENSLKLIALQGVLQQQLNPEQEDQLSDQAINVMTLMDSLL
ncbi:MAG: HEAT repeat domain-containing protein [Cyanobacteria bacterium J06559_3]